MKSIETEYYSRSYTALLVTTLIYFMLNGAQIFETAVIVPRWAAHPPESLQLFHGKYGLDFKMFWIVFHSIHELTFIVSIVLCRKIIKVRNWLLILLAIHIGVRVWTLAYFAPNIIEFQQLAKSGVADFTLQQRTYEWMQLNYLRVAIFILISIGLIPILKTVSRLRYSQCN